MCGPLSSKHLDNTQLSPAGDHPNINWDFHKPSLLTFSWLATAVQPLRELALTIRAPVFVIIRTAIAVLALFLVGHFIIQCGTVPSGGYTYPARSPATAFLVSTPATSNISTSAASDNRCDAQYSFSFAQVGAFVSLLVLVVQIGQALRSYSTAVRREGTLFDLIWSCQLFLCRWIMTTLAFPAAHPLGERFPCSLTEDLKHPFGRPMEWSFVALGWFAIVAMFFECSCLGKSARHLASLETSRIRRRNKN